MSDMNMTSLTNKLQNLELCLKSQHGEEVGYGRALREAIIRKDLSLEVEVLKSLGDLHLQKAKLSKDAAEFDKAAALYAAALLRCTDPDMGETLEHRIGYMEKLSRQLLQGYTPHFRWLLPDYWGPHDSNVLRVAETCEKLDRTVGKPGYSVEESYTEMLVTAVRNSDMYLELEVLKSLGDLYLQKGKATSNLSQFSKAAAMYNKALTRCGDPGTKLTLEHRIRYMAKLTEAFKKKPKSRERRPGATADNTQDQHLHADTTSTTAELDMTSVAAGTIDKKNTDRQYQDHLMEGESSLARADLYLAEQHFAAALKMVHVRDPTAQQYQREVEPLCKLGDVYSKRGQQTGDGGDFVKAAALYNAAIARSEDQFLNGNIEIDMKEIENIFKKCIFNLDIHSNVSQDDTENHKKQLKEMRDQIKLEMETIDQQLDPYIHNEDDPCVKEIEAKRAQAVRQLFDNIAQQRKEFISLLVEECIGLMGPPPCKYALIGLGSQATGLVTPYSDLEFAILVEEESEECLVYFRKLTHYLHLKVVNLGETILPALGIKSLNDFYSKNPLDNWYYDSVTPRGFAFDGSMPKASKTALGRQGTMDELPSELICTPENMVSKLQQDATLYLKEGYHLATILRNPCLIVGDRDLTDIYMTVTEKILQADGGKMALQLAQDTLKDNLERIGNEEIIITARLTDVKKEIYRFPAVAVDCLALSSGIVPTTVWETIEEMENQEVISPNNAHHLTVLTSISAELRLRTYIANGGQKENLSALASVETAHVQHGRGSSLQTTDEEQRRALIPVFHVQNERQLFRYYFTAGVLKSVLQEWSEKKSIFHPFPDFYDNSPVVQGILYDQVYKDEQALSCYHEALREYDGTEKGKMQLLDLIGYAYNRMGDYRNGISYYEQALKMCRSIYGHGTAHPDIASLFNSIGSAWSQLGDNKKSISYHEQALQMYKSLCDQDKANPHIATSLDNLGLAWHRLGDYRKSLHYHEQALQMNRIIYGQRTASPEISNSLYKLGISWSHLGDHNKAISYHEQALQMLWSIYGHNTVQPDIVRSLISLGEEWSDLGDYRKAISYHEQALQMNRSIYGQSTPHAHTGSSLNNLGLAWSNLGDHRKAISYYEQTLQMYRSIHGQSTAHPDIAGALNNLGSAWSNMGDHRKAISYHEQALQMLRNVYDHTSAHPNIATLLRKLGEAWHHLGDYRKAISYHEQDLQMCKSIYGHSTAHPLIASSLNNLGVAWRHLDDYRKAVSFLEQALEMYRSIYGQSTAHPQIAMSFSNVGTACHHMGDYKKAISYHKQALQMCVPLGICGQSKVTAISITAASLNNLGMTWYYLGDHKTALSLCQQALVVARQIYPQDSHPLIMQIKKDIAFISS
uniref:Protein-PII uridylyltransferase N-terminal domain-containing protein n=1 Tax=Branchiostoma floridae TaxID=7739 RepID=C3YT17_BRAFL|eukprot:XP_002600573.1 hypothetical protein BRAFLDRAFT_70050 [Branchiostoma floridae]